MDKIKSDRRICLRLPFKTAMRVRVWKSGPDERKAESENLSEQGTFFATDTPVAIGSALEILVKMPEEITGKPATEWRCTGHVVRLQPVDTLRGKFGVGVQFDCYEILRSKAGG
jgi:PilZ domain